MTLRAAYRVGHALALTMALAAVLTGGELALPYWLALFVPWVGVVASRGAPLSSAAVGTAIAALGLAHGAVILMTRGFEALVLASTSALAAILVGRLIARTTLAHDLQALLMSLLLIFAGAGLHSELTYGLFFALYAISVVWALTTRQLVAGAESESLTLGGTPLVVALDRRDVVGWGFFAITAGVSLVVLASTVLVFLLFPRIGIGQFGMARASRLPEHVSLAGEPRAAGGTALVARVGGLTESNFDDGIYLRGPVLERAVADGFERAAAARGGGEAPELAPAHSGELKRYEVYLQPLLGDRLLALGDVMQIEQAQGGTANPSLRTWLRQTTATGEIYLSQATTGPVRYHVRGWLTRHATRGLEPSDEPLPRQLEHFLALPESLPAEITALAQGAVMGRATAGEKASALREFLRARATYSLEPPRPIDGSALKGFLQGDRRGHCEHFATAFALMLRAVGIPARVVGGFHGGLWDAEARLVVLYASDAHAWVEWYAPGVGWVTDDATPPQDPSERRLAGLGAWLERMRRAWDDYILDYGLREQLAMLDTASDVAARVLPTFRISRPGARATVQLIGGVGLVAVVVGTLGFWVRRRSRSRGADPVALVLLELSDTRTHAKVRLAQTPRELLASASPLLASAERLALERVLLAYEARRFGGAHTPRRAIRDDVRVARELVRAVRKRREAVARDATN